MQSRTMLGKAFRAVAQDRQAASLMGINTSAVVRMTFALAGAVAAIGAVLLAPKLFVKLENGILLGIQAFIAAVLGGLGSTRGAVVGGYAIIDVPDLDGDEPAGVTVRRRPCGETRENDPRSHLAR